MIDFNSPAGQTRDSKLLLSAINKGWINPEKARINVPKMVYKLAMKGKRESTRLRAALTLDQFMRTNAAIGVAEDIHDVATRLTVDERRARLLGVVAAIRDRCGLGRDPGASNGSAS